MLVALLLPAVDEGLEAKDVLLNVVEVDDAGVEVVLALVVDVDVVLEELDVELVVEVVEVDGLQVDVEPVLVDDDVVPEDDVEVQQLVVLLLLVVDGVLAVADVRLEVVEEDEVDGVLVALVDVESLCSLMIRLCGKMTMTLSCSQ